MGPERERGGPAIILNGMSAERTLATGARERERDGVRERYGERRREEGRSGMEREREWGGLAV